MGEAGLRESVAKLRLGISHGVILTAGALEAMIFSRRSTARPGRDLRLLERLIAATHNLLKLHRHILQAAGV